MRDRATSSKQPTPPAVEEWTCQLYSLTDVLAPRSGRSLYSLQSTPSITQTRLIGELTQLGMALPRLWLIFFPLRIVKCYRSTLETPSGAIDLEAITKTPIASFLPYQPHQAGWPAWWSNRNEHDVRIGPEQCSLLEFCFLLQRDQHRLTPIFSLCPSILSSIVKSNKYNWKVLRELGIHWSLLNKGSFMTSALDKTHWNICFLTFLPP